MTLRPVRDLTFPLPQPAPSDGQAADPAAVGGSLSEVTSNVMGILNTYIYVFLAAFLVTLLITPLVRRMAVSAGIIDRPDNGRKAHKYPVAYLGGVAVFAGLIVALGLSFVMMPEEVAAFRPVPMAIIIGMVAIAFTGFADDVWGWDPRLKIMGQLIAAAALAIEEVGVRVAAGVLGPMLPPEWLMLSLSTPVGMVELDVVYWVGTALIAVFVLGGCNAANLIDGLDGLLSGVIGIVALGLLVIALLMVPTTTTGDVMAAQESLAGARVVLCLALLGAVLGFLPHNFNPASIFLGDCGSLLLGYVCAVIILMFGEQGQTHLVFAGLIVFALPIVDTTLAIIRRWLAGIPMSAGDDQHLHHQLKRGLGGVKRAVFAMYGISLAFGLFGVTLAALVIRSELRVRFVYVIAAVLFGFIGVIAVKAARRQQILLAVQPEAAPVAQADGARGAGTDPDDPAAPEGPVRAPASSP